MAILSQFNSTSWIITLNREINQAENEPEFRLGNTDVVPNIPADIAISGSVVRNIRGSGLTRTITLEVERSTLPITDITINQSRYAGMEVIATQNADQIPYLTQIRNLLDLSLTAANLPDSTIEQPSFLRTAELQIYDTLMLTDATYDTKAGSDELFKERVRIATMYHTAALLIPVLPNIVETSTLRLRTRYTEIDWQLKRDSFLKISNDSIKPDIPGNGSSDVGVVVDIIQQCALF